MRKRLTAKQKKIARLGGNKKRIDAADFRKLRKRRKRKKVRASQRNQKKQKNTKRFRSILIRT